MLSTGKELRAKRLGLGMSSEEVGKITYMSKQAISLIEIGKSTTKSKRLLLDMVYDNLYEKYCEKEKEVRIAMGHAGIKVKDSRQVADLIATLEVLTKDNGSN